MDKLRKHLVSATLFLFVIFLPTTIVGAQSKVLTGLPYFIYKKDGTVYNSSTKTPSGDVVFDSSTPNTGTVFLFNNFNTKGNFDGVYNLTNMMLKTTYSPNKFMLELFAEPDQKTLITTVYGAVASNGILSPLSVKGVRSYKLTGIDTSDNNLEKFYLMGELVPEKDTTPPGNVGSLTATPSDMMVDLQWIPPQDADFSHVKIYRDDVLIVDNLKKNSYSDLPLVNDTNYVYKIVSVDTSGNQSLGRTVNAVPVDGDNIPPPEVTNLETIATFDSINLKFVLPTVADFDHVTLFKDGIAYTDSKTGNIDIPNLKEGTLYSFKIVTVDKKGNVSAGVVKSISTLSTVDDTPPSPPTGLSVAVGNGGVNLNWNNNLEPDLDGYNIYVDGKKVNSTPIRKSSYALTSLNNQTNYMVSITAIDKSGNESLKSQVATATPSSDAIPVLGLADYELTDVADGVGSWFSSLWLLIAFSAAIPLAFYVSNRIKLLFIA